MKTVRDYSKMTCLIDHSLTPGVVYLYGGRSPWLETDSVETLLSFLAANKVPASKPQFTDEEFMKAVGISIA